MTQEKNPPVDSEGGVIGIPEDDEGSDDGKKRKKKKGRGDDDLDDGSGSDDSDDVSVSSMSSSTHLSQELSDDEISLAPNEVRIYARLCGWVPLCAIGVGFASLICS
jgi:hypothetical protein